MSNCAKKMEEMEARIRALESKLSAGPGEETSVPPGIDWSGAPDWARYAAMDDNREWYWFGVLPEAEGGAWGGMLTNAGRMRWCEMDPAPKQDCDWAQSLGERPEPVVTPCPVVDWSGAPDWARYAAVDATGERWFYEERPEWDEDMYEWVDRSPDGRVLCAAVGLICVGYRRSLVERPGSGHWSADPDYPVSDWQFEVRNNDTRLGYREWVEHQREAEDQDPD